MKQILTFLTLTLLTLSLRAEKIFDLSKRTLFWQAVKFQKAAFVDGKGLELSGSGRVHSRRFKLNAAENGMIQLNIDGKVRFAKLYFRQGKDKLCEAASVRGTIVGSTIIFDTARNKLWQGEIAELRFDIIPADSKPVTIKSIECKVRRTTAIIDGAWQKKKFIAPGQTLSDTLAYDLRLPVTLRCHADAPLVLKIVYRDIYGKPLRRRNTTFTGTTAMPLFELPEKTAAIEIAVTNCGSTNRAFSITAEQPLEAPVPTAITCEKYRAKLLSPLPENTDENFVWHPEIEVAPFRAGSTCMLYFTADDGRCIIVANSKLTAKSNKLNTLFFRYLTPGRDRLHLEVNDRPVELAGNTEFHHRNHAPVGLPKVEIDFSGARPEYVIDGKERVGTAEHLSGDPKLAPKAFNQIINAVDAGVKGVRLRLIFRFTTGNKVDFSELVEAMESVLLRKPEVNLMIHVSVTDPGFKFRLLNPAEGIKDDKGSFHILNYRKTPEATSSMASEKWQRNSKYLLTELVKHLDSIPAGRRLIGILPCSGITWEWLHWGSAQGVMVDYSEHYRKFYHRFLQKRYHNIAALNAAWHSNFKSFDEISIPSPARRKMSTGLELRSPAQFQPEIDHVDSLADLISGVIIDLCSTIKTASGNRLLTGTYYGYTNYLTGALRSHNAGHNAVMRIMRSPSLDILMAPSRYAGRTIGGGGFMFPEGSARLHSKLVISECDIRPVGASNASGRIDTISGSRAIFEREYGAQLAAGAAMRWFDFSHGWVMQEPRLLEVVKRTTSFDEKIRRGNFPVLDIADTVAVFTSERSAAFLAPDSRLHDMILENIYRQLINSGTAFKMYDLQDLPAVAKKCKVMLFLNAFILTGGEKALLKKIAADPEKTLIFIYGTGLNEGQQLSAAFMSELFNCGFKVYDNRKIYNYRYKKQDFTTRFACAPVYIPAGGKVLIRATDGTPALVQMENKGAKLLFAPLPLLPPQVVTRCAAAAGLPYADTGKQESPVWFGSSSIVIHSGKGCEATIRLPRGFCGISDYATGKFYPAVKGVLSCRIPAGGSWWGELVPAGKKR